MLWFTSFSYHVCFIGKTVTYQNILKKSFVTVEFVQMQTNKVCFCHIKEELTWNPDWKAPNDKDHSSILQEM